MALSHVVSAIFNVEKYRDLEIPEESISLKVVLFNRLVIVSYIYSIVFYSKFDPKMHHF